MTLIDELDKLYKKHGYFMEKTISIPVNDKVSLFDIVGIVTDGSLSISNLTLKDNIFHFDIKSQIKSYYKKVYKSSAKQGSFPGAAHFAGLP